MKISGTYIAGAILASSLALGVHGMRAVAHERGRPDHAHEPSHHYQSELQRDQQQFETDGKNLIKSLGRRASQEQIAREQNRVRQDWQNIVLDRGQSRPAPQDQIQNLASRRGKRVLQNAPRS
jgi:hypothetical protein